MTLETLKKLHELGFFQFLNTLASEELGTPTEDIDFEQMKDDLFVTLGMSGYIKKFFIDKYNMLGNAYSNASGYLYEIHDAIGGTHRIDSGFIGDDEASGTFTTNELATEALIERLIKETNEA